MRIDIDNQGFDNIIKQLDKLKENGAKSMYHALLKVAFKVKAEAQMRLTGRGHIVTSRLKNSIFIKSKNMTGVLKNGNESSYSDVEGKSYSSDFECGNLDSLEFAVGTNVEYAAAIELGAKPHVIEAKNKKVLSNGSKFFGKKVNHPGFAGDSFLYWAMKNVDVMQSVAKDLQEDLKTGKFVR